MGLDPLPTLHPALADLLLRAPHPSTLTDEELGIAPPQLQPEDLASYALPQQGWGQQLLGSFAGAENQQGPPARNFGEGLVQGLGRGLGTVGSRIQAQRAKLEQQGAARQAQAHQENVQATQEYRKERAGAVKEQNKEWEAAQRRRLESPPLTAEMVAANPRLKNIPLGTPMSPAELKGEAPKPSLAEIETEAAAKARGTASGGAPATTEITPQTLKAAGMTQEGLDSAVRKYHVFGTFPQLGMRSSPVRNMIMTRYGEMFPNGTPGLVKGEYDAEKANLSKLSQQGGFVRQAEATASKNADQLRKAVGKVVDTGSPLLNAIVRPGVFRLFGNEGVRSLQTNLGVVRPEFSRILNSGPSGGGTLTNEQKQDLQQMLGDNFTKKNLLGALDLLKLDAGNRVSSIEDEIASSKSRLAQLGLPEPGPETGTAQSRTGVIVTAPNGKNYTFQDEASAARFRKEAGIR